jgi:hypothetical protein
MKMIRIGKTVINLDAIASAQFVPAEDRACKLSIIALVFIGGHAEDFEGEIAELAWAYLTAPANCRRLYTDTKATTPEL